MLNWQNIKFPVSHPKEEDIKFMQEEALRILAFIKTEDVEMYVKMLHEGLIQCPRLVAFKMGDFIFREQMSVIGGLGPFSFDRYDQEMIEAVDEHLSKCVGPPHPDDIERCQYLFKVIIPEVIIYALQMIHHIPNKKDAENLFRKMGAVWW